MKQNIKHNKIKTYLTGFLAIVLVFVLFPLEIAQARVVCTNVTQELVARNGLGQEVFTSFLDSHDAWNGTYSYNGPATNGPEGETISVPAGSTLSFQQTSNTEVHLKGFWFDGNDVGQLWDIGNANGPASYNNFTITAPETTFIFEAFQPPLQQGCQRPSQAWPSDWMNREFPVPHDHDSDGTTIMLRVLTGPSFAVNCTPPNTTIAAGSSTSFNLATVPSGGFNRPVTFTAELSPTVNNPPAVSFDNNNQVPPATTIANINTSTNTTRENYTILFTGRADTGQTASCLVDLRVTGTNPDFNLIIQPYATSADPVQRNIGPDVVFQVFAECLNGFQGPIFGLAARTTFTNLPTPTLGVTQLDCDPATPTPQSTTLTVTNTNQVIPAEQSSWPNLILPKDVFVAGSAQL